MTFNNHYLNNEFCNNKYARTQEELQNIVKQIRTICKTETIDFNTDYVCTVYTNESLGLRYWVIDKFGIISSIDEERQA